ncbi:hypothetical protein ACE2AJ_15365 [Aquihabitans daechungensis]|uniref:hypothetical protein n=1 Tax=Aquihabitans daechungensis TaxID=1052257 RepID=UPI003BA23B95
MSGDDLRRPIVLDGLPEAPFRAAVGYLDDALRECQLVLVAQSQGHRTDADLGRVASGLVPDIEEIGDAFRAAEATSDGAGSLRLAGTLTVGQAATIADLQVQLVHLRILGRRGDLLLDSDPEIAALLTWIWEETSDQLQGRAPARTVPPGRRLVAA